MADERNGVTVIAAGTSISGTVKFEGPASVEGAVEGSIASTDRVDIGREAAVSAQVDAETVLVDGTVTGNVTARDRVEMNATARLEGDVTARTLIVSEGASFVGHCRVGAGVDETSTANAEHASDRSPRMAEVKPVAADNGLPASAHVTPAAQTGA